MIHKKNHALLLSLCTKMLLSIESDLIWSDCEKKLAQISKFHELFYLLQILFSRHVCRELTVKFLLGFKVEL